MHGVLEQRFRILGIAYGNSCLDVRLSVRNLEGTSEELDDTENSTLQMMIKDLDLTGKHIWNLQWISSFTEGSTAEDRDDLTCLLPFKVIKTCKQSIVL